MTIIEYKDQINTLNEKVQTMIDNAKAETRDLTDAETNELAEAKKQIEDCRAQIKVLEESEKRNAENLINNKNNNTNKNITRSNNMKKTSLIKEIRKAIDEKRDELHLNAETRSLPATVQVTGQDGVHDSVVETEIEGILTGLYPNSILEELGVRMYTGIPRGDVQIPIMSKNTVKWEGETDEADATANTFSAVKLSPKRLSAYIDISKQLLYQDTIGVENAVRNDLVRALRDKIEATMFGDAAGTTEQPAGLFYDKRPTACATFADICNFEGALEEANVYGNMKYAMNPKAKAAFRAVVKGNNNSGFVYEAGEMDGTPTFVTTNIADNKFIYGDFSDVVFAVWNDLDLTIDTISQATRGCVRIVVNAYVDFKVARGVTLGFGEYAAGE